MNTDRAFSHRRRHSLYVSGPHVADRKHSRQAGLQHFGGTIERPMRVAIAIARRIEVAARQNEAFLIECEAALQPFGSRRSRAALARPRLELWPASSSGPTTTAAGAAMNSCYSPLRVMFTTVYPGPLTEVGRRRLAAASPNCNGHSHPAVGEVDCRVVTHPGTAKCWAKPLVCEVAVNL